MAKHVLTDKLSEPLAGAKTAKVDVDIADGNLTIDSLADGEQVLAKGTLQYLEKQGLPTRSVNISNGQTTLTLTAKGTGQPWFRLPWAACNGGTEWQIHLNPNVQSEITARSGGGNVKLNLTGMSVTRVSADTGGGNMDVVLPDNASNLSVIAKTGAGNVDVYIPGGIAARIHATTGLGKVLVDPRFSKMDNNTYQSSDFDRAADKVELTVGSGAGNVSVNTK